MDPTEDRANMLTRLDLLQSRVQITDLVHRYAQAVRGADVDGCIRLFTADAEFMVCDQDRAGVGQPVIRWALKGREAIRAFLAENLTPGAICPLIHDLLIDIRGGDATANCAMTGAAWDGRPQFMGVYDDSFRREPDWLFTSRAFTLFTAPI
jgi:ketosteroid isomerase-like protein